MDKEIRSKIKNLIFDYEAYINLLEKELEDTAPIAHAHGWKSSRYEVGEIARERIRKSKKKLAQDIRW